MATLTTLDQVQFHFDPNGIVAIPDRDPSTGKSVTPVYGLNTNYLNVDESVQDFLARLDIANEIPNRFDQLTHGN